MIDLDAVKKSLETRLTELQNEAREIDAELRGPLDQDAEERAVEMEDDEVLEGLGHSAVAEIAQIRLALERIEEGTYGECTRCGEPVGEARLAAIPHAALCIACAGASS